MDNKRLFLLDAYALIFRAYYALIKMPRISSQGFNTSAIFGFVNTLEELLRKEKPSHLAVCFDPPGPTFRHEADANYKAERAETPEDIKKAIPFIKQIIEAYRIPIIEVPGFEADDVIGTLATIAAKEDFTTFMMTPDKDFGQLVSPNVFQYKPSYRGQDIELRGEKEVCEKYGINRTEQVIDLLALMGDKVDNIPGCPGVGEKTAVKLIVDFDNVENLLNNTDKLKGALKKKVEENAEQIRFSKFLATIRTDVPIDISLESLRISTPDTEKLFAIFHELEFKSLETRIAKRLNTESESSTSISGPIQGSLFDLPEMSSSAPKAPISAKKIEFTSISESDNSTDLKLHFESNKEVAIMAHYESSADMESKINAIAVAFPNDKNFHISGANTDAMSIIFDALASPDIKVLTTDSKRLYIASRLHLSSRINPLCNFYDVSIAHYLLQPELRHDIVSLSESILSMHLSDDTADADNLVQATCAIREMAPYIDKDIQNLNLNTLLNEIELPLVSVLADMEIAGVLIDVEALNDAAQQMRERLSALESEIYQLAGLEFNIGSPARVGEILFDVLHLDDKAKKTKSGKYSTSEDVLQKLTAKHPIVEKILLHRSLKKLLSTYLTALPSAINPQTGRIHTTYNQTITATGRLSSSNPNLQNIPVRDGEGREIRRAFIPSPGNLFLSADYSQIELRLVADFAGEDTMIDAFKNNEDIHTITAANIYHTDIENITIDQRRHAKTANFGILYGISAFGLAQRLSIPRSEAKALIDGYFQTFPKIQNYMEQAIDDARKEGIVRTKMGRQRILADINSKNPTVRGYAERNAINAPIQGTAADIIKKAMIDITKELRQRNLKTKMIMQVHDELNFDVPPQEVAEVQELVTTLMQDAFNGKVPLTASVGIANNWLDAH